MKKSEIIDTLTEMEITHNSSDTKAVLEKLLPNECGGLDEVVHGISVYRGGDAMPSEIEIRGVVFLVGEEVMIYDAGLMAKIAVLPYFETADAD